MLCVCIATFIKCEFLYMGLCHVCVHERVHFREGILNYSVQGRGFPGWIFHLVMICTCEDNRVGGSGAIDHIVRQETGKHSEAVR